MENNEDSTPLEVLAPSAIMAMEKAQIDMQIATAHQYPRSLETFKKRALAMATLDPETAESCVYVRPVGKEKDEKGVWREKFAEGPSIRLAEIVAVSYGNIRAASKVVEQTERYVKCTGMAHDLESNSAMSADVIESTVTREGKPYSERQRALIAKVCSAKAIRDAIFKVVPRALCKPILQAAKKVAAGLDKPLEERRKKAQAWIGTLKIKEERVFAVLGVAGWSDVTDEHLLLLTGLKTAMGDGDETIDSAFPPVQKEEGGKPVETPLQKAKEGTKAPEKPPTKPQDAPAPATTPPAAQTAPTQAPVNAEQGQNAPPESFENANPANSAQSDEKEEAAAGLAPETKASETPATPTTPFVPNHAETPALQNVRYLLHKHGKTEDQLLVVLLEKKLRKENQRLEHLAEGKLVSIGQKWNTFLEAMK